MRWDGRPFSVGADAPGRPLLPLRGNSPSAHIGPTYARLMHLPCNPFLYLIFCQASGGPLDGSLLAAKPLRPTLQTCHWHVCFTLRFRFPPFPVPIPLKTTKEGASGPPSLESPPSCSTDSAPVCMGSRKNAPRAQRKAVRGALFLGSMSSLITGGRGGPCGRPLRQVHAGGLRRHQPHLE